MAMEKRVRMQSGVDLSSIRARYSQDGRWLFVCAGSAVRVYSTVSRQLTHILSRHDALVTSCCINPVNTLQLLTASLDGKVIIWDYIDGALLREIDFGVPMYDFVVRPGKKEPRMFFQIEKDLCAKDHFPDVYDAMEVAPSERVAHETTNTAAEKVVIGVSSEVILHRSPAVPPASQMAQATEYLELGIKPSDMCFSYNGEFVLSFVEKNLVICNISKRQPRSFQTPFAITAIASHPSELCIATGNYRGEIELWWSWSHRNKQPVTTVLHWHAHTVADLCFTSEGTYLLSGGEECVLVVWQLASCKSHYRPRLGAQITRVACSPTDQSFAISLQNNIIQVVSGLDNNVEWSLGGMRRAHTQDPKENGTRTGLLWDPRSLSIVANSNPGCLQWYRPEVDLVSSQLDVTGLNYVSRRDEPFVIMTVEHAAFSTDGQWLATVEWRDDGKTTPELRLKFWQFDCSTQEFELNTCIDPPHNKKVTSLVFKSPPPRTETKRPASKDSSVPPALLAVSTSEDGKFKSWVLVDREGRGEEGEERRDVSWACRSVGYYHSMTCRGACFSQDGSLLAVNFGKFLTLWDPYTCELRKAFSCPFPPETFARHTFGNNASSHYLLASSDHHLIVWDLLSCSVLWSVGADVDVLVADPTGPLATAFVSSKQNTTHLYRFHPSSPTPVSVWDSVCSGGSVTSAVYTTATREWHAGGGGKLQRRGTSTLYFQTSTQVLYRVCNEGEDPVINTTASEGEREERSRQAYFEVFGEAKKGELELRVSADTNHPVRPTRHRIKVLDAAPHTLPPLTSLSGLFLHSLLPAHRGSSRGEKNEDVGSAGEEEEEEEAGERGGESDESDTSTTPLGKKERTSSGAPPPLIAMETDNVTLPGFTVANFDWLTREHFGGESRHLV